MPGKTVESHISSQNQAGSVQHQFRSALNEVCAETQHDRRLFLLQQLKSQLERTLAIEGKSLLRYLMLSAEDFHKRDFLFHAYFTYQLLANLPGSEKNLDIFSARGRVLAKICDFNPVRQAFKALFNSKTTVAGELQLLMSHIKAYEAAAADLFGSEKIAVLYEITNKMAVLKANVVVRGEHLNKKALDGFIGRAHAVVRKRNRTFFSVSTLMPSQDLYQNTKLVESLGLPGYMRVVGIASQSLPMQGRFFARHGQDRSKSPPPSRSSTPPPRSRTSTPPPEPCLSRVAPSPVGL